MIYDEGGFTVESFDDALVAVYAYDAIFTHEVDEDHDDHDE